MQKNDNYTIDQSTAIRVVYLSCPQSDFNQHLKSPNCKVDRELDPESS